MRIDKITLSGYERLTLSGKTSITITPTSPIQFILGTNGIGKSSLVKELSPLPADHREYVRDGFKLVDISKGKDHYTLRSSNGKHSFVQNGEELNPGGTVGVQRSLVETHFNYTAEIHALLTGVEKFAGMLVPRRREWLTRMNPVSLDYAIGLYNKARERERDTAGAVKLLKRNLVTETARQVDEAVRTRLQGDIKTLDEAIQFLYTLRTPQAEHPRALSQQQQTECTKHIETINRDLQSLLGKRLTLGIGDRGELVDLKTQIELERSANQAVYNQLVGEYRTVKSKLDTLTDTGDASLDELNTRRQRYLLVIEACHRDLEFKFLADENTRITPGDVHDATTRVLGVLTVLPDNTSGLYTKAAMREAGEAIDKLRCEREKLSQHHAALDVDRRHMEKHLGDDSKLECPRCKHHWHLGYDAVKHAAIVERLELVKTQLSDLDSRLTTEKKRLETIREYQASAEGFMSVVTDYPNLHGLWAEFQRNRWVAQPAAGVEAVSRFVREFERTQGAVQAIKDLKEVDALVTQVRALNGETRRAVQEQHDVLVERTELAGAALLDTQARLAEVDTNISVLGTIDAFKARLETMQSSYSALSERLASATINQWVTDTIAELQRHLAIKRDAFDTASNQQAVVLELTNQLAGYEAENAAAKELVAQLSPTEGLIAESMTGFLQSFIRSMNHTIGKVWSYPLKVQECALVDDSVELSYEFPLESQESKLVPDVKFGSTAQKDIVNFAFVATAARFLGLRDSMLFLDEFAASFDPYHRSAALMSLKDTIEQEGYQQIWMISHYTESYSAFPTAEYVVLCDKNIVSPSTANQHVMFT